MAVYLRPPFPLNTDDGLEQFSRNNPGYRIEREEDGSLIVSPTHTKGGAKSLEAAGQLWLYAKRTGGKAFDCNTGFALGPRQRIYAPDASWVSQPRIDVLESAGHATGYWPISPDVAIEVKSLSDRFSITVRKTRIFVARGSTYAVAINPETREIVPFGALPELLVIDFDAIIDA